LLKDSLDNACYGDTKIGPRYEDGDEGTAVSSIVDNEAGTAMVIDTREYLVGEQINESILQEDSLLFNKLAIFSSSNLDDRNEVPLET
jgi:hypothetical protein